MECKALMGLSFATARSRDLPGGIKLMRQVLSGRARPLLALLESRKLQKIYVLLVNSVNLYQESCSS